MRGRSSAEKPAPRTSGRQAVAAARESPKSISVEPCTGVTARCPSLRSTWSNDTCHWGRGLAGGRKEAGQDGGPARPLGALRAR
ncbi:hypothetical protein ACFPRL_01670 [Pseudoclavibacter helvolus]